MGRFRNRPLFTVSAFLVLAGAATFVLNLRGGRARGDEEQRGRTSLIIQGPNDGEPLNNSIEFHLEVALHSPSYVVLYEGSRYLSTTLVDRDDEGTVSIPLDSTYLPNGPVRLTFYLFHEEMDRLVLVGVANWTVTVENPLVEVLGQRLGSQLPLRIRGRPGDLGYHIEASHDPDQLMRSPEDRRLDQVETQFSPPPPPEGEAVETIQSGQFAPTDRQPGGEGPTAEIVLNVDVLARNHTLDGAIIVWTYAPDAKWAHSKPLSIRGLVRSAPLFLRLIQPPRTKTTYRR